MMKFDENNRKKPTYLDMPSPQKDSAKKDGNVEVYARNAHNANTRNDTMSNTMYSAMSTTQLMVIPRKSKIDKDSDQTKVKK